MKGYRTYVAIILTALVYGLLQLGILTPSWADSLIAVLSLLGLYFRSQANK